MLKLMGKKNINNFTLNFFCLSKPVLPITDRLPDLRSSDLAIDKTKPLPTSLQSDFLPEDVLFALTQPPQTKEPLGPASRFRNLNTSVVSIFVISEGGIQHRALTRI